MEININQKTKKVDISPDTPLLWVLRDVFKLPGTKFGCGIGQCGACTVLIDGKATRSCLTPIGSVKDKSIITIEGKNALILKLQEAWIQEQVPQCGYCQSGMILSSAELLEKIPNPTDEDIEETITNICRCGTYSRIQKAIHLVAKNLTPQKGLNPK